MHDRVVWYSECNMARPASCRLCGSMSRVTGKQLALSHINLVIWLFLFR